MLKWDDTETALGRSVSATIKGVHTPGPNHPPFPRRYTPACSLVR